MTLYFKLSFKLSAKPTNIVYAIAASNLHIRMKFCKIYKDISEKK